MDEKEFKKTLLHKDFWKAFKRLPYGYEQINKLDKKKFVSKLFASIQDKEYYPSPPWFNIVRDKGNSVSRVIPVFKPADYCVYYYCIKRLESKIAINRTPNTFGGWTLGGALRKNEEDEIELRTQSQNMLEDGFSDSLGISISSYSFNPWAWGKIYGDFNSKLYATTQEVNYKYAVELDIANFYDAVRLDILELKIRQLTDHSNAEEVSLLFHFLNYWNRKSNFYNRQVVGLPQDALNDCSRILANFYLQDYDKYVFDLCELKKCRYFRYADDQFIFSETISDINLIVFKISKKLNDFGLSINQKKVKIWKVDELVQYRSFDIFEKIRDEGKNDPIKVEEVVNDYIALANSGDIDKIKNKGAHILNRLIFCCIDQISLQKKKYMLAKYLEDDFLLQSKSEHFKRIYDLLSIAEEKSWLIKRLGELSRNTFHNNFHFEVHKFFKLMHLNTSNLVERINELMKD